MHESHEELVVTINTEIGYMKAVRRRKVVCCLIKIACDLNTFAQHVYYFSYVRTVARTQYKRTTTTTTNKPYMRKKYQMLAFLK